jgi:putative ABC transport system permease protein
MQGGDVLAFAIAGRPVEPGREPTAAYHTATPDFFAAMGIPLQRGRAFKQSDALDTPLVAVVNQAWARRFFPNEEVLGQRIDIGNATDGFYEIVGIVGSMKVRSLDSDDEPVMFVPLAQDPFDEVAFVVRTQGNPLSLVGAVREQVRSLDARLPIFSVRTMEEVVADEVAQPRAAVLLLGLFALLAVVLAAVGLYGTISYVVVQRIREIGIRLALGAQRLDVLRLVVGQGLRLVGVGASLGSVAALALTRLMRSLLFGVSASDPLTFVVAAVLLVIVALVACWIPARRAARVDPMVALRYE